MLLRVFLVSAVLALASAQQAGDITEEYHPPITIESCDNSGCKSESAAIVLDGGYRWLYSVSDQENCQNSNGFDPKYCPDGKTCAENCALNGVDKDGYENTYGITTEGDAVTINYLTKHDNTMTIGSRSYLLTDDHNYRMFMLKNRELTFDVDASTLACGMNGALYLVEMEKDGGTSSYPTDQAGAKYGTGYCDAQCPNYIPFIAGEANIDQKYGICCIEMDLFEANSASQAYTTHGCTIEGYHPCLPDECGDGPNGVCDKTGCDYNAYRLNNPSYYGRNSTFEVDTSQIVTIVTQFVTRDGSDGGELSEIRRLYVQNGKVIQNAKVNFASITDYDSISDQSCDNIKKLFGEPNDFEAKGALKSIEGAIERGMVIAFSLWEDYGTHMLWLDGTFPPDADPNSPGVVRGPCGPDSGNPDDMHNKYPDSYVTFSNIKVGTIDSTYKITN